MDPNKTLAELRSAAIWLYESDAYTADLEYVLSLFEALDEWLSQGGFLPADWQGRN